MSPLSNRNFGDAIAIQGLFWIHLWNFVQFSAYPNQNSGATPVHLISIHISTVICTLSQKNKTLSLFQNLKEITDLSSINSQTSATYSDRCPTLSRFFIHFFRSCAFRKVRFGECFAFLNCKSSENWHKLYSYKYCIISKARKKVTKSYNKSCLKVIKNCWK